MDFRSDKFQLSRQDINYIENNDEMFLETSMKLDIYNQKEWYDSAENHLHEFILSI